MHRFFTLSFIFLLLHLSAEEVIFLNKDDLCKKPFSQNAILRRDKLFVDDFLTLHSLLKMTRPKSVFEIGTCTGEGTLIIKNAIGDGIVYSIELPMGESSYDIRKIGEMCYLPYVQIIGNSLDIDYSQYYPIEAWFIDGAHEYAFVVHETKEALLSSPNLIVWHDSDIPEVLKGIIDGLKNDSNYILFRVIDTRIAFAVPKTSPILRILRD